MKKNRIIVCCEYNELVDSIISQILERKSDLELLGIISINGLPNNEKKTKTRYDRWRARCIYWCCASYSFSN